MIVVGASCPDALLRSNNSRPASEGEPRAETWSVSRTSNLFFVGLLLPILASEPLGFPRYLVVGHAANGAAPILLDGPQLEDLCAQLSDLLLEVFHAFFKCLRQAGKIDHCSRKFQHEMQPRRVSVRGLTGGWNSCATMIETEAWLLPRYQHDSE